MRHNLLPLFCVLCAFCGCRITAQGSAVMVDDQGNVVAPPNVQLLESVTTTGGSFFEHYAVTEWDLRPRGAITGLATNTVEDAVLQSWTVTPGVSDYLAQHTYQRNPDGSTYSYASDDEALATVDSDGLVSYVADGEVEILVTLGTHTKSHTLTMSGGNSYAVTNIVAGVDGYLRYALTDGIDTALTADAGANDDELFDTKDWVGHTYVRNASAWAYAATGGDTAPWTGLAVWATGKTSASQTIRGTLISPNVVACAWHNQPAIGSQYKWLGSDNQIYTRTVSAKRRLGSTDGCLVLLDSPLPAEVEPLSLMPPTYTTSHLFTNGTHGLQLPVIAVNKQLQAMVADLDGLGLNDTLTADASQVDLRTPYYQKPISGDSGTPVIFVMDGDLILAFTWLSPGGGAHFLATTELLTTIEDLGGTAPAIADLSPYTANVPSGP